MSSRALGPVDKLFIYMETHESMMHTAGLMIFSPPADAGPEFVREMVADIFANATVEPPWNMKLATPDFKFNPGHKWVTDTRFDLDYHVRHLALPAPGGERELGKMVSRLHSQFIDLHRPPWELHIIEGLAGGRFALYIKTHHALLDGYSANKLLTRCLSESPNQRKAPMFFSLPEIKRERPPRGVLSVADRLREMLTATSKRANSLVEVGKAAGALLASTLGRDPTVRAPLQGPVSILNRRIGRNRRFATQQVPIDRMRAIAEASGGTLNDVIVAISSAGVRRFLTELNALPKKSLVGYLPVAVRAKGDEGGGNALSALLVPMATDIEDPVKRLAAIITSTTRAKGQLKAMSKQAIMDYGTLIMLPYYLQVASAVSGNRMPLPVNYNVCISNVPGPEKPLFLRGARMDAAYPVSIPTHGAALNITISSYAGYLNFGFIGCRDTLPSLQRLAVYTGEALNELELAIFSPPSRQRTKAGTKAAPKPKVTAKITPKPTATPRARKAAAP